MVGSFINGQSHSNGAIHRLQSPADGSDICDLAFADLDTVKNAIESAETTFEKTWSKTSIAERQDLLTKLAGIIQERAGDYVELESANTGKTLRQSMFMDIPLGISHIEYFASTKEFKLHRKISHPEFPGTTGVVENAPMGVVGAITPWNVPFLMAVWKIIPAILAGNTIVVKPSHYTPLTTIELAKDAKKAGFPDGVINVVLGDGGHVGETLCKDDRISMLSFTGSTSTGKRIMRLASEGLKKVTLELGGKSPNIVLSDADVDHAAKGVLFGIFLNSGQLCESGSRLLVHENIRDKLLGRITHYLERMKAGNPLDLGTDISAITTSEQLQKIKTAVDSGVTDPSSFIYRKDLTGQVPERGLYYPPTVVSIDNPQLELFREEIFGPVLAVTEFEKESEAVEIANDSEYGLAAAVWSNNVRNARKVASRIQSGTVWINDYHLLSAAAPRGGFKKSGIGRELGLEGVLEYTQTRHIFINEHESDLDKVAYGLLVQDE